MHKTLGLDPGCDDPGCDGINVGIKKKQTNKQTMSQSLWQIGRPDLNAFFFLIFVFVFVFFLSLLPPPLEQQTCQIWVGHRFVQYEIWNLIFGWTRYKTEHRVEEVCCSKCFIASVVSFHVYFDKQSHKKLEKITSKKIK